MNMREYAYAMPTRRPGTVRGNDPCHSAPWCTRSEPFGASTATAASAALGTRRVARRLVAPGDVRERAVVLRVVGEQQGRAAINVYGGNGCGHHLLVAVQPELEPGSGGSVGPFMNTAVACRTQLSPRR